MDLVKSLEDSLAKKDRLLLLDIIFNEHSYTKPFQAHPDFNRIHSAKVLNFKKQPSNDGEEKDKEIDVLTVDEQPAPLLSYDETKVRSAMTEVERCLNMLISESTDEDERILRSGWTADQAHLFDQVHKSLLSYQLARLTYEKNPNEPILRRLALDKAVKRVRGTFAGISWDPKLTSWLHCTLIDGLGTSLFLCYVEILQGLKNKVPVLIDKLFSLSSPALGKRDLFNSLSLTNVLKKSWDPSVGLPVPAKAETLPGQQNIPCILVIPSGPSVNMTTPRRARFWHSQLSAFGRTVPVNMHTSRAVSQIDVKPFLENMISAVRSKILEFKASCPDRKLVLIGWHIGALVACEVALLDTVSAVVCLGFPCVGLNGSRDVMNDPYQEIRVPTMFVLGSHSPVSPIDSIEVLRERMKTSTQLVVVEGGDEMLRLTCSHRKRLQLTQNMVDKLIIGEIQTFLKKALSPEQNKTPNSPGSVGGLQSCKAKADRKRKLKRALITKHTIEQKKKKKVETQLKGQKCTPNTPLTDAERVVNVSTLQNGMIASNSEQGPDKRKGTASANEEPSQSRDYDTLDVEALQQRDSGETTNNAIEVSKDGTDAGGKSFPSSVISSSSSILTALKNGQGRIISKRAGKPVDKIGKRPKSRKIIGKTTLGTTGSFTKVSQAGTITLQSFPPGSVLLSGTGSHVRFHRGTSIFYVPSSSGPTPIVRSSSLISSASPKARQVLVTPATNRPITAIVNASTVPASTATGIAISCGVTTTTTTVALSSTSTMLQDSFAKPSSLSTQLSQTDIQCLANMISKHRQTKTSTEKPGMERDGLDSGGNIRSTVSPISTRISIGTISNLNATEKLRKVEAAHDIASRDLRLDSKGSVLTDKGVVDSNNVPFLNAKTSLDVGQKDASKDLAGSAKTPTSSRTTVSIAATSQGTKTVPVTLTIPLSSLPGNFAIQPSSFSLKALPKGGNAKLLSKMSTTSASTLSALLTQQKFVLSSVSNPSTQGVITSKLAAVAGKDGSKTTVATAATSLAVQSGILGASVQGVTKGTQGKQTGSTSLANFVKAPATITLHLPSSAILRDPKFGKDGNSQIKFIGLLNAQGRSPISSPIHFSSLKARSAPVSPSGEPVSVSGISSVLSSPQSSALAEEVTLPTSRENGIESLQTLSDSRQSISNHSGTKSPIVIPSASATAGVKGTVNSPNNDVIEGGTVILAESSSIVEEGGTKVTKLAPPICAEGQREETIPTPTRTEE